MTLMDIVTHIIVGAICIEGVLQWRRRRGYPAPPPLAAALWIAALVGSVLPDLDWVLATLVMGGKLGRFVHYQGYLHSIFGVFILSLLASLGARKWVKAWKGLDRDGWYWVFSVFLGAGWIHIGLDALTQGGVHLFLPFSGYWTFGDTFYFVEPWLWICALPPLFLHRHNPRVRFSFAILFVVVLVAIWFSGRVPWYAALLMTVVGVGLWRGVRPLSDASRLAICMGLVALVTMTMFSISQQLKADVRASHWLEKGNLNLKDVMVTAMPGNPLCWWIIAIEGDDSTYRMKSGVVAAFPSLVPATKCPLLGASTPSLKMDPVVNARPEQVLWAGQYDETRKNITELLGAHCGAAAYFRSARAPYFEKIAGDLLMGDLRYDRQPGYGFSEVQMPVPPRKCPTGVPGWPAPRREAILGTKSEVASPDA